jgi:hypothetical protein
LRMVKGSENELYLKLKERFDLLTGKGKSNEEIIVNTSNKEDIQSSILKGVQSSTLRRFLTGSDNESKKSDSKKYLSSVQKVEVAKSSIPVIHNPKMLIQLLGKFSENNHPLKYACHSWDYGQIDGVFENYFDFIRQFDERGKSICFDIQKIKKTLGTKILHFLNTVNEGGMYYFKDEKKEYHWGESRIRYGWKSVKLKQWCEQHPNSDPFEFPLPNKTVITKRNNDLEISKFGDVVKIFKEEIEIRPEESALYNLFAELRRKHLGFDFHVTLDDSLKGKQFYTDVQTFKRALNKIFIDISRRTVNPNVTISAKNYPEEKYTLIEILHEGSYSHQKSSEEMIEEIKDGDFSDILENLKNLCDWSIESKFSDGVFRINYLSSFENGKDKEEIDEAKGFKHQFKFYKT